MSYAKELSFKDARLSRNGHVVIFYVSPEGVAGDSSKLLIGEYGGVRASYMYDAGSIFAPFWRRRGIKEIMAAFNMMMR